MILMLQFAAMDPCHLSMLLWDQTPSAMLLWSTSRLCCFPWIGKSWICSIFQKSITDFYCRKPPIPLFRADASSNTGFSLLLFPSHSSPSFFILSSDQSKKSIQDLIIRTIVCNHSDIRYNEHVSCPCHYGTRYCNFFSFFLLGAPTFSPLEPHGRLLRRTANFPHKCKGQRKVTYFWRLMMS